MVKFEFIKIVNIDRDLIFEISTKYDNVMDEFVNYAKTKSK